MSNPEYPPVAAIVEENDEIAELLDLLISGVGYLPRRFSQPTEVITAVEQGLRPNLLVTEFKFPPDQPTGEELALKVRQAVSTSSEAPVIPVVLLFDDLADGKSPDRARLANLKDVTLSPKPFDAGQLMDTCSRFITSLHQSQS